MMAKRSHERKSHERKQCDSTGCCWKCRLGWLETCMRQALTSLTADKYWITKLETTKWVLCYKMRHCDSSISTEKMQFHCDVMRVLHNTIFHTKPHSNYLKISAAQIVDPTAYTRDPLDIAVWPWSCSMSGKEEDWNFAIFTWFPIFTKVLSSWNLKLLLVLWFSTLLKS